MTGYSLVNSTCCAFDAPAELLPLDAAPRRKRPPLARAAISEALSVCAQGRKVVVRKLQAELQQIGKEIEGPLFTSSDCTSERMTRLLVTHGKTLFHAHSDAGDAIAAILGR